MSSTAEAALQRWSRATRRSHRVVAAGTVGFLHSELVGTGFPCLIAHGGPGLRHGLYRGLDPLAAANQLVCWDHRTGQPCRQTASPA